MEINNKYFIVLIMKKNINKLNSKIIDKAVKVVH